MATRAAVLFLLALGAAAVQARSSKPAPAPADFKGTLEKNGYQLAAALFDIANLSGPLSKPPAVYTVLVPTDAAIEAFLKQMGLTVDDLKKRPLLAKQVAAQHLILKANVRPQELFANGPARIVATAAGGPNELLFTQAGTAVKVADVHGNTANVQKMFIIDDNKTAHPINKVLMPDTVFFSFADLCAFRPLTLKEFCNAAVYAGLNSTLNGNKLEATVFVPNSKAFLKAVDLTGGDVPTPAATADILKYHIVSGYKTLGHGLETSFKADTPEQTLLAGQTLEIDYERVDPAPGDKKLPYAKAFVTSTSGNKAEVLRANVHVGAAVAHGVNAVLLPGKAAAAATKPGPAGAAAPTKPGLAGAAAATKPGLVGAAAPIKPGPAGAAAPTKPGPAGAAAPTKPGPARAAAPTKPGPADATAATKPAPGDAAAATKPAPGSAAAPTKPAPADIAAATKPAPADAAAPTKPGPANATVATKPAPADAAASTKPGPANATAATKPVAADAAAATKPGPADAAAATKPAPADSAAPTKPGPANATAATKPGAAEAAAAAKAAVAAPTKPAGRKLLDFGWSASAGSTAEDDAATAAITAAANGQENVNVAARGARVGADELSIPGDYAQVDDGINWW